MDFYVKLYGGETPCYYCGQVANTIDHYPPRTVRSVITEYKLNDKYPFCEVDCCRECNSILSDKSPWTLSGRKELIKTVLEKRYRKYLEMPDWTQHEMEKLGPGMQKFILHSLAIRNHIRQRLKY